MYAYTCIHVIQGYSKHILMRNKPMYNAILLYSF